MANWTIRSFKTTVTSHILVLAKILNKMGPFLEDLRYLKNSIAHNHSINRKLPGVPNKGTPIYKSPKIDCKTFNKISFLPFFVHDPKIFGDDKIGAFDATR